MPPKPIPYPGDDYVKSMIAKEGYIKKDDNGNLITGIGATVDSRSSDNVITGVNAVVVKSNECILNARNVKVFGANNATANGADHTIGDDRKDVNGNLIYDRCADYSSCDGDANTVKGYGSSSKAVGIKNSVRHGIAEGQDLTLGNINFPNQFQNSSLRGNNCTLEGNGSHGIGSFLKIIGDNIFAIGNGSPSMTVITEPGFHVVTNGIATKIN